MLAINPAFVTHCPRRLAAKFLFSESSASYGAGDEARRCLLRKHIVSSPSSRRGSTVHRTVEFNRSSLCRLQKRADAESICSYGAGDEARTRYLHLGKVALYRMSYARNGHGSLYRFFRICQALFSNFFIFLIWQRFRRFRCGRPAAADRIR